MADQQLTDYLSGLVTCDPVSSRSEPTCWRDTRCLLADRKTGAL